MDVLEWFRSLTTDNTAVVFIIWIVGLLRVVNKPLFAGIRSYVQSTESKEDDEMLDAVERSKTYRLVSFILDWTTSVKMKQ